MNTFQKVIKYVAMAFAVLLTVGILTGIVGLITVVSTINDKDEDTIDYQMVFDKFESMDIQNGYGKLSIKPGDGFRIEAYNVSKDFNARVVNGTLTVDEAKFVKKFLWINFGTRVNKKSNITIYVPDNFSAKSIEINSGAGEVNLENFTTERLIIDAGVGDLRANNILANKVEVSGGVGSISFTDVDFTDVDFDSGVGNLRLDGVIRGESEFDFGVGSVKLKIEGKREDYALKISGLGRVSVNGDKVSSNYSDNYRSNHTIRIDGGVGDVDIEFLK